MATLDIFNDSAFGMLSLTAAINQNPEGQASPDMLDDLFSEEGVTTTSVFIERNNDSLDLVPAAERGAPASPTRSPQRDGIDFRTIHLPTDAVVRADEIQNIRAFGRESELEQVQGFVDKRLLKMRQRLTATIRYHRMGAVAGQIYDADGKTLLYDLFKQFGIKQQVQALGLANSTSGILQKIVAAQRMAEDVIAGAAPITGWRAVCGRGFMDAMTANEDIRQSFQRINEGSFLVNNYRGGFPYAGVMWKEYYGKLGSTEFIDTNSAYLIPTGVPDLLITRFAPSDHIDVVNTTGVPYYASQELMKHGKGIELEAQSNALNICTRPRAIIKLTA